MRVLVVDDDTDFLHLARRALEQRGHEVETTSTAFGLVNRVAGATGAPPDAVVLDCELPGLSGVAVIELLAKDRRTLHVPVVLVSAADSESVRAAAANHPLASFAQKDGHMRALVEHIEAHVVEASRQVHVKG